MVGSGSMEEVFAHADEFPLAIFVVYFCEGFESIRTYFDMVDTVM